MSKLHRSTQLYVAALALAALAATLVALAQAGTPSRGQALLALLLGGLATVAWLFPLPLAFKTHLYLDTSVFVAAILLLEPGWAIVATGAGTALAHAVRRQDPVQTAFNAAQAMLQVAAGCLVLAAGGWQADRPPFDRPEQVLLIGVAGLAMLVVNHLAVAVVVGLQAGAGSLGDWSRVISHTDRGEHFAQLAQFGLGVMAAVLVAAHPWTLALLLLPAAAVHGSLGRAIRLQRRAEEALQDSEAALAQAQRVAGLGSWDWNLATGDHFWSAEVYRLLGFSPRAVVPSYQAFLRCVHPEDRDVFDQAVHDAVRHGTPFSLEHRLRRPDGTERIVQERGIVVVDAAGKPPRLVGTVHDITERRRAEEARDALLAAVSHDLKNPLTVIGGQAQLLRLRLRRAGAVEPGQVAAGLEAISAAVAEMRTQLDELVDAARLRNGSGRALELRPGSLDLVALARERAAVHQRATDRHAIRVEAAVEALVGHWDHQRLVRVLDNLLGNAVKYSPAGGEITVRVSREGEDPDAWAVLAVADRGLGIPAADLAHVGEPLRRGANVGGIAGTGIGLAGARQIVAQHGGTIAVASQEGRGSTFTVRLPLAESPSSVAVAAG